MYTFKSDYSIVEMLCFADLTKDAFAIGTELGALSATHRDPPMPFTRFVLLKTPNRAG